jgi:RNA polymerase sigma-70 factor, ECF subfamily
MLAFLRPLQRTCVFMKNDSMNLTSTSKAVKFNQIWLNFSKPVKEFIRNQTHNSDITDDLLQEVFIKIHQHLLELQDEERLAGWVFQIARNTVLNYFRDKKNHLAQENNEYLNSLEETYFNENKLNTMVANWLESFRKDLDPKYEEALRLVDIEGLSQVQLAEKLGISVSGAKSRVQRGREQLKQKLMDCCPVKVDAYGNIVEVRRQTGECLCT